MSTWSPGSQSPTVQSARYQVRKQIRDGVPEMDATPVPFEMVRLESLGDQIATTTGNVFQLRFENVPLERFATVWCCPGTLVAYLDGSWAPTYPTVDVDQNGNFTLPVAPAAELLVTYGWQFFTDSDIDSFVDEARQWLREFAAVTNIPDALSPALIHYAAGLALSALARQLTLSPIKGGDADFDPSVLAKQYQAQAAALMATATAENKAYYDRGFEKLAPAVDVAAPRGFRGWTPSR